MLEAHWSEIQLVETSYWTTDIWIREDSYGWKSSWHVDQGCVKREAKALCRVGRHELWLKTWVEDLLRSGLEGEIVGCLIVWVQPTCIVKAPSWACSKSLQCKFFPFNEKWPKHGEVWLLLMRSVPKLACHFLGQWLRRVRHAKTDREEKKENKGHSALWVELK